MTKPIMRECCSASKREAVGTGTIGWGSGRMQRESFELQTLKLSEIEANVWNSNFTIDRPVADEKEIKKPKVLELNSLNLFDH